MKKTLLLSVVASTMIMAGGDIAPVEPIVEAPVVAPVVAESGWDFNGQGVLYYQTTDANGAGDLFEQESSAANVGIQLGAVNTNLIGGLGMGLELSGLGTLDLQQDVVSSVMQTGDGSLNSGAVTQAYLTYGINNTSIKVGRQQLPLALSPFAFSESWNVFKNTFEAALLVNSDIQDTTLVYAFVNGSNNHSNLSEFTEINDDGVHMVTAQNKSVEGLTLTGTWYMAPDFNTNGDAHILWGDAKFAVADYAVAVQGGTVMGDAVEDAETVGFGAKIGGTFGMFNASLAYSTVDDGAAPIHNLGTGVKTPLYTQMIANQNAIKSDSDTFVGRAGVAVLDGNLGLSYGYSEGGDNSEYTEADVVYTTKITDSVKVLAAYVYQNTSADGVEDVENNIVRVWGRYNF